MEASCSSFIVSFDFVLMLNADELKALPSFSNQWQDKFQRHLKQFVTEK